MTKQMNSLYVKTARIFEDIGGYFVCSENSDYLDTRGTAHPTKASALRAAINDGYTHAVGSGTSWEGKKRIPAWYRN